MGREIVYHFSWIDSAETLTREVAIRDSKGNVMFLDNDDLIVLLSHLSLTKKSYEIYSPYE